jgi:protein-S-isoprenylcysteine O-methyltransferase Ste14
MAWGMAKAPGLLQERSQMAANVKTWDKYVNLFYTLSLMALLVVAGLDAGRYGWSQVPGWVQWLGAAGMFASGWVIWRAMVENAFLARWARIQSDRGQRVISSGPYRVVRHPMYAAIILLVISMSLQLGSWWALVPAGLVTLIYLLRTRLEDQMLQTELDGYREYAARVRYRLFPGVW